MEKKNLGRTEGASVMREEGGWMMLNRTWRMWV